MKKNEPYEVRKIKQLAKKYRKEGRYPELCHSQILDLIVRESFGLKDWNVYIAGVEKNFNVLPPVDIDGNY